MNNTGTQSLEQKRKMNMVLNNLEKKLGCNKSLCQAVAMLIDMMAENAILTARLEEIKSNIPEIQRRISDLISSCTLSCDKAREDVLNGIYRTLSNGGETPISDEYMLKIEKTIDCCIEEYPTYKESTYNAKYCVRGNSDNGTLGMSIEELLMLI
jgi:phosphotransacetylase